MSHLIKEGLSQAYNEELEMQGFEIMDLKPSQITERKIVQNKTDGFPSMDAKSILSSSIQKQHEGGKSRNGCKL